MARQLTSVLIQLLILFLFVVLIVLAREFFRKGWPRRIALSGFFLPVIVGICVRQYLHSVGKPVMSWDWILPWFYRPGRLLLLLIVLAYWDVPFLAVAALADKRPLDKIRNRSLVYGAFSGTLLFTILVFGDLWRDTEAVVMISPMIPLFILPGTLLGLAVGWAVGRFQHDPAGQIPLAHP